MMVRNPWEEDWMEVDEDEIVIFGVDIVENVDAISTLSFMVETKEIAQTTFHQGTFLLYKFMVDGEEEVEDDYQSYDFAGICVNAMSEEIEYGGRSSYKISVEGIATLLEREVMDYKVSGLLHTGALAKVLSTFQDYFDIEIRLGSSVNKIVPAEDSKVIDYLRDIVGDRRIVDDEDVMNIRFAHFYFQPRLYALNDKRCGVFVVETEPDVRDGEDYEVEDGDIKALNYDAIDLSTSSIFVKYGELRRRIKFANLEKNLGRNELFMSSKSSGLETLRMAILTQLKTMVPTKVLTLGLVRYPHMKLNKRVRVVSATRHLDDTFIILKRSVSIDPNPTMSYELGYNLQDMEDFLEMK